MQPDKIEEALAQLRDISGLSQDNICFLPLAIGWWVIISFVGSSIFVGMCIWIKKILYKITWKYKAFNKIKQLQKNIKQKDNLIIILGNFSTLLRNIVIHTYSRKNCANLNGELWLDWLTDHDPCKYNWHQHEYLLLKASYSNNLSQEYSLEIEQMLKALTRWVR